MVVVVGTVVVVVANVVDVVVGRVVVVVDVGTVVLVVLVVVATVEVVVAIVDVVVTVVEVVVTIVDVVVTMVEVVVGTVVVVVVVGTVLLLELVLLEELVLVEVEVDVELDVEVELVVEVEVVVVDVLVTVLVVVVPTQDGLQASAQLTRTPQRFTGGNGSSHLSAKTGLQLTTSCLLVLRQSRYPGLPQRELVSARLISFWQAFGITVGPSTFAVSFTSGLKHCLKRSAFAAPSHGHASSTAARTAVTASGSGHLVPTPHLNLASACDAIATTAIAIVSIMCLMFRRRISRAARYSPGRSALTQVRACEIRRATAGRRGSSARRRPLGANRRRSARA